ncbi:beta/alpha barrel domain-containing protein [Myroides phaeus]|uniref:Thiamine-phosphate pyrophosphorylase n=1 Tax=Myroides phaeus TaxID=702745 RepID=A0A1G8FWE9_9FLAO|nr:thiamine phosphate synthase [Myroides phaeus]MEC4115414.1 thiamine phosphate synthase [Myroides phaeus]SDH86463.1 thiamine-phosphate pyrophosphorylase [Myroides phaeus]
MVLITMPNEVKQEATLINKMFDKGLPLAHVRKPDWDIEYLKLWLKKIDKQHHRKLVIHISSKVINNNERLFQQYLRVINNLDSYYTHLSTINEALVNNYISYLPKLSTSVHCISEYNKLSTIYHRAFISPIYPSISKPGYASTMNWTEELAKKDNAYTTLVALGGIKPTDIPAIKQMGLDDYALLGCIWLSENPLKTFELCQHYDQLS